MAALRSAGSIKITAAKVGQQLSRLQSYQAITESANVSSFQKTMRKRVKISDALLGKHAWTGKSLFHAAMNYREDLAHLQFYGQDLWSFECCVLLQDLQPMDAELWKSADIVQAVIQPWTNSSWAHIKTFVSLFRYTDSHQRFITIFAACETSPLISMLKYTEVLADMSAAIAGEVLLQKYSSSNCKGSNHQFRFHSDLPRVNYVGARARCESAGLHLSGRKFHELLVNG